MSGSIKGDRVILEENPSAVQTPDANELGLYWNNDNLYSVDENGVQTQLSTYVGLYGLDGNFINNIGRFTVPDFSLKTTPYHELAAKPGYMSKRWENIPFPTGFDTTGCFLNNGGPAISVASAGATASTQTVGGEYATLLTTNTTSGNRASIGSTAFNMCYLDTQPMMYTRVRFTSMTNFSFKIGFFTGNPTNSFIATGGTGAYVGFPNTGSDIKAYTSNASVLTTSTPGIAMAIDTWYDIFLYTYKIGANATVHFLVTDGTNTLDTTISTTLPATNLALGYSVNAFTHTTASREMYVAGVYVSTT